MSAAGCRCRVRVPGPLYCYRSGIGGNGPTDTGPALIVGRVKRISTGAAIVIRAGDYPTGIGRERSAISIGRAVQTR